MRGETLVPIGEDVWGDTRVGLADLPGKREWRDALGGRRISSLETDALGASLTLSTLPLALLAPATD